MQNENLVIRKNALWLFWGQLVGRLLRTAIIIFSARILLQESWGAFNYVLSIATFLTVLSDIGLNALLTREAVKRPEMRRDYISTALFIKMVMLLALAAGFVAIVELFPASSEVKMLLPLMMLIFMFDSLRDMGAAIARANEEMEKEGFNNIITNFFIAGLGFVFLYYSKTSLSLALAYALGTGFGLVGMIIALRRDMQNIFSHFNKSLVGHIITSAWPFGLVGLTGAIMLNTDIFLIGAIKSLKDVALYSAPQKIVQLLYIAPVLISTAFFPAFARYIKDSIKFKELFETAISVVSTFALPVAVGAAVLAKPIIVFVYGESFQASYLSFTVLAPTIMLFSILVLMGNAIFAHDKPRVYITYSILAIFGNLFLDLIFIPTLGIEGAALATLLNQLIIGAYAYYQMRKIIDFTVMRRLGKIALASLIMGITAASLEYFNIEVVLNIAVSGFAYLGLLYLLKEGVLYNFFFAKRGRV